ncbi:hypothetical protein F2Q69_00044098 [Brassica cretica]|uniref:Uncharacterized protein n=2 Tax=Brassica TaxID=3705 RepID=A0A8S9NE91_BRACR|nr:hypothetical protein F2Q69_00044098 [Brassica cretica]
MAAGHSVGGFSEGLEGGSGAGLEHPAREASLVPRFEATMFIDGGGSSLPHVFFP